MLPCVIKNSRDYYDMFGHARATCLRNLEAISFHISKMNKNEAKVTAPKSE